MIGFPPAGGCVTFNNIIKLTPNPTASGKITYKGRGIKYKKNIPTRAVRRWQFKPKTIDGIAVDQEGELLVEFECNV